MASQTHQVITFRWWGSCAVQAMSHLQLFEWMPSRFQCGWLSMGMRLLPTSSSVVRRKGQDVSSDIAWTYHASYYGPQSMSERPIIEKKIQPPIKLGTNHDLKCTQIPRKQSGTLTSKKQPLNFNPAAAFQASIFFDRLPKKFYKETNWAAIPEKNSMHVLKFSTFSAMLHERWMSTLKHPSWSVCRRTIHRARAHCSFIDPRKQSTHKIKVLSDIICIIYTYFADVIYAVHKIIP